MANDVNLTADALQVAVKIGQQIAEPRTEEKIHFAAVPAGTELKSLAQFQYPQGVPPDHNKAAAAISEALKLEVLLGNPA